MTYTTDMNYNIPRTTTHFRFMQHSDLFDIIPVYRYCLQLSLNELRRTAYPPPDTSQVSMRIRRRMDGVNKARGMDFVHRGLRIAAQRRVLDRQEYDNIINYTITRVVNLPAVILDIVFQFLY
jgi:hypothetical protein